MRAPEKRKRKAGLSPLKGSPPKKCRALVAAIKPAIWDVVTHGDGGGVLAEEGSGEKMVSVSSTSSRSPSVSVSVSPRPSSDSAVSGRENKEPLVGAAGEMLAPPPSVEGIDGGLLEGIEEALHDNQMEADAVAWRGREEAPCGPKLSNMDVDAGLKQQQERSTDAAAKSVDMEQTQLCGSNADSTSSRGKESDASETVRQEYEQQPASPTVNKAVQLAPACSPPPGAQSTPTLEKLVQEQQNAKQAVQSNEDENANPERTENTFDEKSQAASLKAAQSLDAANANALELTSTQSPPAQLAAPSDVASTDCQEWPALKSATASTHVPTESRQGPRQQKTPARPKLTQPAQKLTALKSFTTSRSQPSNEIKSSPQQKGSSIRAPAPSPRKPGISASVPRRPVTPGSAPVRKLETQAALQAETLITAPVCQPQAQAPKKDQTSTAVPMRKPETQAGRKPSAPTLKTSGPRRPAASKPGESGREALSRADLTASGKAKILALPLYEPNKRPGIRPLPQPQNTLPRPSAVTAGPVGMHPDRLAQMNAKPNEQQSASKFSNDRENERMSQTSGIHPGRLAQMDAKRSEQQSAFKFANDRDFERSSQNSADPRGPWPHTLPPRRPPPQLPPHKHICLPPAATSKVPEDNRPSVIIRNLNSAITEADVRALCSQYIGPVVAVKLKSDSEGTRARVIFVNEESIQKAIQELDEREADEGVVLKVTLFPPQNPREREAPAAPTAPETQMPALDPTRAAALSKWKTFTKNEVEVHPAVAGDKIGDGLLHRMGVNFRPQFRFSSQWYIMHGSGQGMAVMVQRANIMSSAGIPHLCTNRKRYRDSVTEPWPDLHDSTGSSHQPSRHDNYSERKDRRDQIFGSQVNRPCNHSNDHRSEADSHRDRRNPRDDKIGGPVDRPRSRGEDHRNEASCHSERRDPRDEKIGGHVNKPSSRGDQHRDKSASKDDQSGHERHRWKTARQGLRELNHRMLKKQAERAKPRKHRHAHSHKPAVKSEVQDRSGNCSDSGICNKDADTAAASPDDVIGGVQADAPQDEAFDAISDAPKDTASAANNVVRGAHSDVPKDEESAQTPSASSDSPAGCDSPSNAAVCYPHCETPASPIGARMRLRRRKRPALDAREPVGKKYKNEVVTEYLTSPQKRTFKASTAKQNKTVLIRRSCSPLTKACLLPHGTNVWERLYPPLTQRSPCLRAAAASPSPVGKDSCSLSPSPSTPPPPTKKRRIITHRRNATPPPQLENLSAKLPASPLAARAEALRQLLLAGQAAKRASAEISPAKTSESPQPVQKKQQQKQHEASVAASGPLACKQQQWWRQKRKWRVDLLNREIDDYMQAGRKSERLDHEMDEYALHMGISACASS
ncbi:hypothetical protein HDU90_006685 [Geranomyces variabilis]|nr:hypothetical protein HDU90_006685 [Geranomyces variabilis]